MVFSLVWDGAFEAEPADTEVRSLGAERIRDLKVAVRERMQVDHTWETDHDGQHSKVTLRPQLSDLPTDSLSGQLYTKNVGGIVELFYIDSSGQVVQITSNGALA